MTGWFHVDSFSTIPEGVQLLTLVSSLTADSQIDSPCSQLKLEVSKARDLEILGLWEQLSRGLSKEAPFIRPRRHWFRNVCNHQIREQLKCRTSKGSSWDSLCDAETRHSRVCSRPIQAATTICCANSPVPSQDPSSPVRNRLLQRSARK